MLKGFKHMRCIVTTLNEELTQQRRQLRIDQKAHYAARSTK